MAELKEEDIISHTATDAQLPTATDTQLPTATDTQLPTATDTQLPTATDTQLPTATATQLPTATDTQLPTATDTQLPTATATQLPTAAAGVSGDLDRTLSELLIVIVPILLGLGHTTIAMTANHCDHGHDSKCTRSHYQRLTPCCCNVLADYRFTTRLCQLTRASRVYSSLYFKA